MSSGAAVLESLLNQNTNHTKIKETVKVIAQTRQKVAYHSLVSSSETYLHVVGLANHQYDEFNYINKLLHQRIMGVCAKIKRQQLTCRNPLQQWHQAELQKERQQQEKIQEIAAQVEYVVNSVDLPLSLFKRNDKYWYPDNPKTIEAKNFVHQRIEEDRKRKRKFRSQIMKRQSIKEKLSRSEQEKHLKYLEQMKRKKHEQINKKIQQWKKSSEDRKKIIEQSQKYGSSLKPLYKKMQNGEKKKNMNALNEYKQKLSQIRNMHRSIEITEIKEHQQKLMKLERQKQFKKILNDPMKVKFKSKYHSSMTSRSRMSEYQTTKSLYEKRREYGTIIKQQFKPQVDQKLVKEMEERLKIMNRKRTRKNPKKKNDKKRGSDDDDDEDQEEQEEEEKPKTPKRQINSDDDDDEDDEDDESPRKQKRIRGEDQDPDRQERYELGMDYLEYVRNLPKKKKQNKQLEDTVMDQSAIKQEGKTKNSQRYKDYLRQFVKTNRSTIDHIDTKRIKKDYNKSIINSSDYQLLNSLENQARKVETKIKNEEQLLKYRKLKDQDAMEKKVEIDNAVIDTIKARLAMMG